jgi:ABC-type sugar transport system permease subunit
MANVAQAMVRPEQRLQHRKRTSSLTRADARLGVTLVLPAVITIVAIIFMPLAVAFWDSLHQLSLRFVNAPRPLIGLQNYGAILADSRWHNALRVTLTTAVTSVFAQLVLGMVIALALNRAFFGRGLMRAAVLVPWALTSVVSAKMWAWIFDTRYGVMNDILMRLQLIDQPLVWMARADLALPAMIVAEIWKTTPFMALLLLAGLQLIPNDLYEAASIDGASAWQRFWAITLPLLKPTILVALLFRTIDALKLYDLPRVLTNGGPGQATETLSIYTYNTLFNNLNFGYGSALAVTTFLVIMLCAFIFIRILGAPAQGGRA